LRTTFFPADLDVGQRQVVLVEEFRDLGRRGQRLLLGKADRGISGRMDAQNAPMRAVPPVSAGSRQRTFAEWLRRLFLGRSTSSSPTPE
jgi:hypothetical protein